LIAPGVDGGDTSGDIQDGQQPGYGGDFVGFLCRLDLPPFFLSGFGFIMRLPCPDFFVLLIIS
jgi:hypothetical protein